MIFQFGSSVYYHYKPSVDGARRQIDHSGACICGYRRQAVNDLSRCQCTRHAVGSGFQDIVHLEFSSPNNIHRHSLFSIVIAKQTTPMHVSGNQIGFDPDSCHSRSPNMINFASCLSFFVIRQIFFFPYHLYVLLSCLN